MQQVDLGSPGHWLLQGEGNANAVFGYLGGCISLVGSVLRVRKLPPSPAQPDAACKELSQELWGPDFGDNYDVGDRMAAVLGSEYVLRPVHITLPEPFVAELHKQLQHHKTAKTPAASLSSLGELLPDCTIFWPNETDTTCFVLDAQHLTLPGKGFEPRTSFPPQQHQSADQADVIGGRPVAHGQLADPHRTYNATACRESSSKPVWQAETYQHALPTLCIEIKPKWGLLPNSPAIPAQHEVRRHVSRFQLQQRLKLAQEKISSISSFDPLDLFSMNASRMQTALLNLFTNPQNNLKLFVDGQPVKPSSETSSANSFAATAAEALGLDNKLDAEMQASQVADILVNGLLKTGILQRLLTLQALDRHDIEAMYPLYQHCLQHLRDTISRQPHSDDANLTAQANYKGSDLQQHSIQPEMSASQSDCVQTLLAMSWGDKVAALRDYLLAATAKDCSLMITMQALPDVSLKPTGHDIDKSGSVPEHCRSCASGQNADLTPTAQIKCKLAVVDLDLKAHTKIPEHHRLNSEIMACVMQATS